MINATFSFYLNFNDIHCDVTHVQLILFKFELIRKTR